MIPKKLYLICIYRLDEYQNIINKQIEAAEKMEDGESMKQISVIKKYEAMLKEQQAVWAKYKVLYFSKR